MNNYLEVAGWILKRCQDTELSTGVGSGGPVDSLARKLSRSETVKLIERLDYESRGEPDQFIRRRYDSVAEFLKEVLDRNEVVRKKLGIKLRASTTRREKRETCNCGSVHPTGANFYVTVTDGAKTIALSGPYPTHAEAVSMVDEIKEIALKVDPSAAFASFGTTAMSSSYTKPGIFR
jgi:predicted acyl esterase